MKEKSETDPQNSHITIVLKAVETIAQSWIIEAILPRTCSGMLVLTVIVVAILMSVIIITANTIAPAIMLSNVAGCMLEKLCVTNDNISIKNA